MPEHPLHGRNFGVVGTVTTLVDLWAETGRLPSYVRQGSKGPGMTEDEARRPVGRMTFDRLIRIAYRLGQGRTVSPAADQAIHQTLNCSGPVLAYTTVEDAARSLLPAGFELLPATYAAGKVYAACR